MGRIALLLVLAMTGLAACSSMPEQSSLSPAAESVPSATVVCRQDEQKGCLSIQILNFTWDANHPTMNGLDQPPKDEDERYDRIVNLGPRLYEGFKEGTVKTAMPARVTVYMWNVNGDVPVSHVGEIRYQMRTPHNMRGTLFAARLVESELGAVFDKTVKDLGEPDRAFDVDLPGFASVLGVPWDMVTDDTYILVCPHGRNTVYPNRATAANGLWITPEFLAAARRKGYDYILSAILSRP